MSKNEHGACTRALSRKRERRGHHFMRAGAVEMDMRNSKSNFCASRPTQTAAATRANPDLNPLNSYRKSPLVWSTIWGKQQINKNSTFLVGLGFHYSPSGIRVLDLWPLDFGSECIGFCTLPPLSRSPYLPSSCLSTAQAASPQWTSLHPATTNFQTAPPSSTAAKQPRSHLQPLPRQPLCQSNQLPPPHPTCATLAASGHQHTRKRNHAPFASWASTAPTPGQQLVLGGPTATTPYM